MVSPMLQKIYKGLISSKESEVRVNLEITKGLKIEELTEIVKLFDIEIKVFSDIKEHLNSLHKIIIQINNSNLYLLYINIIKNIPYTKISKYIYIVDRLEEVKQKEVSLSGDIVDIITNYSQKEKGLLKNAAIKYLEKGN